MNSSFSEADVYLQPDDARLVNSHEVADSGRASTCLLLLTKEKNIGGEAYFAHFSFGYEHTCIAVQSILDSSKERFGESLHCTVRGMCNMTKTSLYARMHGVPEKKLDQLNQYIETYRKWLLEVIRMFNIPDDDIKYSNDDEIVQLIYDARQGKLKEYRYKDFTKESFRTPFSSQERSY